MQSGRTRRGANGHDELALARARRPPGRRIRLYEQFSLFQFKIDDVTTTNDTTQRCR